MCIGNAPEIVILEAIRPISPFPFRDITRIGRVGTIIVFELGTVIVTGRSGQPALQIICIARSYAVRIFSHEPPQFVVFEIYHDRFRIVERSFFLHNTPGMVVSGKDGKHILC